MRTLSLGLLVVGLVAACGTEGEATVETSRDAMSEPPAPEPSLPSEPATLVILDNARIGSKPQQPSYQRVTGVVALPDQAVGKAKLVVDLETSCFPFAKWQTEPPPPGENWPASCDAFDRVFEISMLDPAIEVVHAATPFGGPLHIEQDVSDIVNALKGSTRTFEAYISTYSDASGKVSGSNGGWNVSMRLELDSSSPPSNVIAVVPIFRGAITEGATDHAFPFLLPPGTKSARIEYVTSGHGLGTVSDAACIGGAEEFCKRTHSITIDDGPSAPKSAWRDDCDELCTMTAGGPGGRSYCAENPCGAPQSVRAPRANWCPGSVTKPWVFEQPLGPGAHTLTVRVDEIAAPKGAFRVAAHAIAYQ